MNRILPVLLLTLCVAGCDMATAVKEEFQQARAVETDLEHTTGVRPQVGFNWHNGKLTLVSVNFPRIYEGKSLSDLAATVRTAVGKNFKDAPDKIMLTFALEQTASSR